MDTNRCVCCGDIIPEGMQVCHACEIKIQNGIDIPKYKNNHSKNNWLKAMIKRKKNSQ